MIGFLIVWSSIVVLERRGEKEGKR